MDIVRRERQTDAVADTRGIGRLDHPLEAVDVDDDLIMHTLERDACDLAVDVRGRRARGHDIDILRTDHNVDRRHFAEAAVERLEALSRHLDQVVVDHQAVENVALADEVRNEGVLRLVVNIDRRADLLDLALVHDDDRIAHGERLLLVVRDKDERDADRLLNLLQLTLHVLAQLEIERGKRLIEQQHLRFIRECAGDCDTLLLTAGELSDAAVRHAVQIHHVEHLRHGFLDLVLFFALDAHAERDVFIDIQVREERVLLEDRVDRALVRRHAVDLLATKKDIAAIGCDEAADRAQNRGFAAAGGAEERHELAVTDCEVEVLEHLFAVKRYCNVFQSDNWF